MNDPQTVVLIAVGFVLVMGAIMALTTFGGKFPRTVLIGMAIAFLAYTSVILVRLGVFDFSAWLPWGS